MIKIILVEDDHSIISSLSSFLESEGLSVYAVGGQKDALSALQMDSFDLMLLDVSLEDGNGFSVCKEVKASFPIPVIFLTAAGDECSTVIGLDLGADDYIAKPFRPRELISRIKSVLRRYGKAGSIIELRDLRVDVDRAHVTKAGHEVFLSALEYRLLLVFLSNKGTVLSRNKLLQEIWDMSGEFVNDNTLTVYIKRLREKIEDDPKNPSILNTIRGLGYKIGD